LAEVDREGLLADGKRLLLAKTGRSVLHEAPPDADVVIIGGGVIGVSTAFYSSLAGLDTVVVEVRETLGSLASAASAGTFCTLLDRPEVVALVQASVEVYTQFGDVVGQPGLDIGLHQQGYLFASTAPEGFEILASRAAHKRSIGLEDVELLKGDEASYRQTPWWSDWHDTAEVQALLNYQQTSFPAFLEQLDQDILDALG
jgi:glycine/D-amino acid oxidase-like deaminating enzyme